MTKFQVIGAFVDRRTGKTINPGDPLPKGLSEERLRALQKARCIAAVKTSATRPPAPGSGPDMFPGDDDRDPGAGEGDGQGSGETDPAAGGEGAGETGTDGGAASTSPVAGEDGGRTGRRSQSTARGRRSRQSKS